MNGTPNNIDALISLISGFLREDLGEGMAAGDITSMAVIPEDTILSATLCARESMVLAGGGVGALAFQTLDETAEVNINFSDSDILNKGDVIMSIKGNARAMLAGERTALNIIQHLSGIATLTSQYVSAISHTQAKLLDTRKTTPGLRVLEKYATQMGGAVNHRMGLYDAIMMKDNHIALAGDIGKAVECVRAEGHEFIEVECDNLDQVEECIKAGVSRILLDNMDIKTLKKAVKMANGKVELEASGGVNLDTIGTIAETGVDFISVGRITQSAPAVDIGMDFSNS